MEYSNYELVKNLGMLQSHLDIALKNPEATQHEIEEKLLQKTKANIDSEHPDKGGLILKSVSLAIQGRRKVWKYGGLVVLGRDNVPPPGRDRVNWHAKNWGAKAPPPQFVQKSSAGG